MVSFGLLERVLSTSKILKFISSFIRTMPSSVSVKKLKLRFRENSAESGQGGNSIDDLVSANLVCIYRNLFISRLLSLENVR